MSRQCFPYRPFIGWALMLGLWVGGAAMCSSAGAAEPETIVPDEGAVLTRGPIHEAFAQQTDDVIKSGAVAPSQPPEPIEEIPPEAKPAEEGAEWIPGYWHWDDERNDFIWISGVWRIPPAGMRWVPGYWSDVDGQHRRVSGVWVPAESTELRYQPAPPASLEVGPSSEPPSESTFWVPGSWVYQSSLYRWRPGYWTPYVENRVWVPAHYAWSPCGYVFVDGYWDYPFAYRGTLFCPVYFEPRLYMRPRFRYRPCFVLSAADLLFHLFIRPGCADYYFGDYYGFHHGPRPYYPWFEFRHCGRHYDPFYAHFAHRYHKAGGGIPQFRDSFDYYSKHKDLRPRHTLADERRFDKSHGGPRTGGLHDGAPEHRLVAGRLDEIRKRADLPQRWETVGEKNRPELERRLAGFHQLSHDRRSAEIDSLKLDSKPGGRSGGSVKRHSLALPDSLTSSESHRSAGKMDRPPNAEGRRKNSAESLAGASAVELHRDQADHMRRHNTNSDLSDVLRGSMTNSHRSVQTHGEKARDSAGSRDKSAREEPLRLGVGSSSDASKKTRQVESNAKRLSDKLQSGRGATLPGQVDAGSSSSSRESSRTAGSSETRSTGRLSVPDRSSGPSSIGTLRQKSFSVPRGDASLNLGRASSGITRGNSPSFQRSPSGPSSFKSRSVPSFSSHGNSPGVSSSRDFGGRARADAGRSFSSSGSTARSSSRSSMTERSSGGGSGGMSHRDSGGGGRHGRN